MTRFRKNSWCVMFDAFDWTSGGLALVRVGLQCRVGALESLVEIPVRSAEGPAARRPMPIVTNALREPIEIRCPKFQAARTSAEPFGVVNRVAARDR